MTNRPSRDQSVGLLVVGNVRSSSSAPVPMEALGQTSSMARCGRS